MPFDFQEAVYNLNSQWSAGQANVLDHDLQELRGHVVPEFMLMEVQEFRDKADIFETMEEDLEGEKNRSEDYLDEITAANMSNDHLRGVILRVAELAVTNDYSPRARTDAINDILTEEGFMN